MGESCGIKIVSLDLSNQKTRDAALCYPYYRELTGNVLNLASIFLDLLSTHLYVELCTRPLHARIFWPCLRPQ